MSIEIIMPAGALGPSEYDTPLDAMLRRIAVAASANPEQEWAEKYGVNFENDTFYMQKEDWDAECDCGFNAKADAFYKTQPEHEPTCYQWEYKALVSKYGEFAWSGSSPHHTEFQKSVHRLLAKHNLPYNGYGNHCTCIVGVKEAEFNAANDHLPTCRLNRPNFWHKPSGLKVKFYKYIARSTATNMSDLTPKQLATIEADCLRSLRKQP